MLDAPGGEPASDVNAAVADDWVGEGGDALATDPGEVFAAFAGDFIGDCRGVVATASEIWMMGMFWNTKPAGSSAVSAANAAARAVCSRLSSTGLLVNSASKYFTSSSDDCRNTQV